MSEASQETLGRGECGFTLIELLVTVAIVGILASIAIPAMSSYKRRASIAATASEIRSFITSFHAYDAENGDFPDDFHRNVPADMLKYVPQDFWDEDTPMGGQYNYEGPDNYPYVGLAISGYTGPASDLLILNNMLDSDSTLGGGVFRSGTGGRPTFIIEDRP